MSSSLDAGAIARLRAATGSRRPADEPASPMPTDTSPPPGGWFDGDDWPTRARSFTRRLLAPVERRVQDEVERVVEQRDTDLQRQVEELRAELIRTRTAHEAELAALHEQLRHRS